MATNLMNTYPYPSFARLSSAVAFGVGIAASATYIGANATFTIQNTGTTVVIIPRGGILTASDQRFEVVAFPTYSGDVGQLNDAQANMIMAALEDAYKTYAMSPGPDVLKPGETLSWRVFNRAPAAAAAIRGTFYYYQVEERVFNKFNSNQRQLMEEALEK